VTIIYVNSVAMKFPGWFYCAT